MTPADAAARALARDIMAGAIVDELRPLVMPGDGTGLVPVVSLDVAYAIVDTALLRLRRVGFDVVDVNA